MVVCLQRDTIKNMNATCNVRKISAFTKQTECALTPLKTYNIIWQNVTTEQLLFQRKLKKMFILQRLPPTPHPHLHYL